MRAAHRDRRGRAGDRRPRRRGDQGRPRGQRAEGHPLHRDRSAGSCPSRTPRSSGRARPAPRPSTTGCGCSAQKINEDRRIGRSIGLRYHDGKPGAIEGLLSRGDRRVGRGHRARLARGRQVRRLERALLLRPLDDGGAPRSWRPSASTSTGSPPASAPSTRSCPGTTWTPGWTRSASGTTGRRRSARRRSPTAGGPPATTAASARPWAPRSRSARPGAACSRSPSSDGPSARRARRRRRPSRSCASATPSGAGCGSPPTATSPARSSGRCGARRCRWRSRPASARTRRSPTSAPPPPVRRARRSTSRSACRVRCDPEAVRAALDAALPEDVAVLDCVEAGEGTGSLADRIDTSVWRVELPGVTLAELQPAVEAFLASDVVTVAKRTKNGLQGHRRARGGDQRVGGRGGRLCHTAHGRPAADARCTTRRRVGRPGCRRRPAPAVARLGPCVRRRAGSTTPEPWPIRSVRTARRAPPPRGARGDLTGGSPGASRRQRHDCQT